MATDDPRSASATDLITDRVLEIQTPEHVQISFPLAGPGSRFGALMVDVLVILLVFIAALIGIVLTQNTGLITESLAGVLVIAALLVLIWGYFFAMELLRDGQTIGKRAFGIRTVMDGGHPLNAQAAAVRNLLRLLDVQPFPSCLLGGLTILLDGKGRRLGDLAAGTVVVRDIEVEFPEVVEAGASREAPRLDEAGWRALEGFVERAAALPEQRRNELADRLLRSLSAVAPAVAVEADPVGCLRAFYRDERERRTGARLSTAAGTPAAAALLRVKRDRWTSLLESVRQIRRRRLRRIDEDRVSEFAARYRALSADLARARTYGASPRTVYALEHLVAQAHNLFYRPVGRGAARLKRFLLAGFPQLVRELARPMLLSGVLFYVPAGISYALVSGDTDQERLLAAQEMVERAEKAAADPTIDYRDTWESAFMGFDAFAVFLIANNVQVSLLVFAGGILGGLGSIYLLISNGLHLGVALAVFANRGVLDNIVVWVLPHGAIELTAIQIAGAAGLWMGSALWFPGRERRGLVLPRRARQAVAAMVGVVMLLIVAGLIEGFVSPSRVAVPLKLAAAAAAATWLIAYLTLAGRERRGAGDDDESVPPTDVDALTAGRGA